MGTRHLLVYLSWETLRRWKRDYPAGRLDDKAPTPTAAVRLA